MTVISGFIKAVSGQPATGSITVAAARLRKNIDNTAMIDRAPTRYSIKPDGSFTTDDLDPGPARIIINTNGRQEIYDPVPIPPMPVADLYEIISEAIDYPPDVILEAQAARAAAEKAAAKAVAAEAVIDSVVADGAAAVRAHVEAEAARAEAAAAETDSDRLAIGELKVQIDQVQSFVGAQANEAAVSAGKSEDARDASISAKTAAEAAKTHAENASVNAAAGESGAVAAKGAAEAAKSAAESARTGAETAKSGADAAKAGAEAAQVAAEAARDAAKGYAESAEFKVRPGGWVESDMSQPVQDKLALVSEPKPVSWDQVTGKPSSFTPATHTHAMNGVDGLTDALNSRVVNSSGVQRIQRVTAAEYLALAGSHGAQTLYVVVG